MAFFKNMVRRWVLFSFTAFNVRKCSFRHILQFFIPYVVDFNRKLYLCLSKDLGETLYESETDSTLLRVPYPTPLLSGYWVHNDFTSKGLYVKNADGGDYEVRKLVEQKLCRKKPPWYQYMVHEVMRSFCKRAANERSFFLNATIISAVNCFETKFDLPWSLTLGNIYRYNRSGFKS